MSYKILLADDSVTVQKIITLTFSDEGVDVLTVNNGNDAINRLQYMRPALVMADVSIPGRNGYEICEFVKNHPELRQTPVILLVPAFETFDDERAQRIGADYHLTKPFQSIRTLIATVKNLIERKEMPANEVTPARPAAPETEGDLLNGKSAKIEELLKKSTAPLPPIASLEEAAPLELLEDDAIDVIDLEPTPVAGLAITELEDGLLLGADAPAAPAADTSTANAASVPTPTGDDVLELDDVLPELHPVIELAPTTSEPAAAAEIEPSPVVATATMGATGDEPVRLSPSVIDEIVARVVAQLSAQLADDLAEKLNERLIDANGNLARQLAPQVAEILQTPAVSSYRITENLLEID